MTTDLSKKRMQICFKIIGLLGVFLLTNVQNIFSQGNNILNQSNQMRLGTGIVRIAEAGQLADTINVWGDVQNSGRYLIPKGTTLTHLISYAGGPILFRTNDIVIDWSVIKLDITISSKVDENSLKQKKFEFYYSEVVNPEFANFKLNNDDVVVIQIKRKRNWRDYLQVIAPIASTLTATILLYNLVVRSF